MEYSPQHAKTADAVKWYDTLDEDSRIAVEAQLDTLHRYYHRKRYKPEPGTAFKLELLYKVHFFVQGTGKTLALDKTGVG